MRTPTCRYHLLSVLALILVLLPAAVQAQNVLTWHNDKTRTGQNLNETILTPANVNSTQFGKVFSDTVDGPIYAQPLYAKNLYLNAAQGRHNVVVVATQNDSVYAFDADAAGPPLWQVSLLVVPGSTAVPCTDFDGICSALGPTIGVTSTPVIDPTTNTLYVVAYTKENGSYVDRLHALNLSTGAEKFGGPVIIQASVPGTGAGNVGGMIAFDPSAQLTRPGLLLLGGVVYVSSGQLHDDSAFHGWLLGYNAATLQQVSVFMTTPNGNKGALWGSGAGPVGSPDGKSVYLMTGDGTFDADTGGTDYGDSFVKLGTTGGLPVLDYFTPDDQTMLGNDDLDLGAGGPMIMDQSAGGKTFEIIGAGKEGILYVISTANMGKYSSTSNHVLQTVTGSNSVGGGGIGTPAYFNHAVYFSGWDDYMKMFTVTNGLLSTAPVSQTPIVFQVGTTPSISANGSTNGIVWAVKFLVGGRPSVLCAFNASNLSTMLYNSNQNVTRDSLGFTYLAVPTISNGKVYVGTFNALVVYGLL